MTRTQRQRTKRYRFPITAHVMLRRLAADIAAFSNGRSTPQALRAIARALSVSTPEASK